jgi:uncharacterized membrane protein YhaH (DUF805 family)
MIMPLKRYAEFDGRSQRQEYWMFVLLQAIVYTVGLVIVLTVAVAETTGPKTDQFPDSALIIVLLLFLVYLALFIPTLAARVRRFHDQDLSGWFVLLGFIPYVGWLVILVFMCLDGTAGPNRFGPDPKGRGDSHVNIFA